MAAKQSKDILTTQRPAHLGRDARVMILLIPLVVLMLGLPVRAVDGRHLAELEEDVTEFALSNGLKFIVVERHAVPTVSCLVFAGVGSVNDPRGQTGLAHVLEHVAFKGTKTVGTKDYKEEEPLLKTLDDLAGAIGAERSQAAPDAHRLAALQDDFQRVQKQSQACQVPDEFEEAFRRAGCVGLNARTSYDYTVYMAGLPSNKLELWMSLESDALMSPVFREFYQERNVVIEERRLQIDNNALGRFLEEFRGICYRAHPYGTEIYGHMSDIENLTRPMVTRFFDQFYTPSNLLIVLVGDVDVSDVRRLSAVYFGRIAGGPCPAPVSTQEPAQLGERRVLVYDQSQPAVIVGYHIGSIHHPDHLAWTVLTDILVTGRTARLYQSLVKEAKVAMNAAGQILMGRYPGLLIFYAFPAQGRTNGEVLDVLKAQMDKLKDEPPLNEELRKAKSRAKVRVAKSLTSNAGLAERLAYYQVITGDWRNLFRDLDAIEDVTPEDIQRVARQTFVDRNRCVGLMETARTQAP